ncbi:MAG: helix-hairpin-helix domain-containing protein [Gammaproteobacteria bacterium]
MPFRPAERDALLALKGVGPTVLRRLEEIGIESLAQLADYEAGDITALVAQRLRTTCWNNSPQARTAIAAAIALARRVRSTAS